MIPCSVTVFTGSLCVHCFSLTQEGALHLLSEPTTVVPCSFLTSVSFLIVYRFSVITTVFGVDFNALITLNRRVDLCIFCVFYRFHTLQKRVIQKVRAGLLIITHRHFQLLQMMQRFNLSCSNGIPGGVGKKHVSAHGAAGGCGAGVPWRSGVHLHACLCPTLAMLWLLRGWEPGVPAYPWTQHHSAGVARLLVRKD